MRETKTNKRHRVREHSCVCQTCGKNFKDTYETSKRCVPCAIFHAFSNKYGPTKIGLKLFLDSRVGINTQKKLDWDRLPDNLEYDTNLYFTCSFCNRTTSPYKLTNVLANPERAFSTYCVICCRIKNKKDYTFLSKEYIEKCIKSNGLDKKLSITLDNKIHTSHEKIKAVCKIHKNNFIVRVDYLTRGLLACPMCKEEVKDSVGVRIIKTYLDENKINYETESTFDGLYGIRNGKLKADVYLPDIKVWIEYDGEFHFRILKQRTKEELLRQILNDQIKNTYCKNEGIRLVRIPYWQKNIIPQLLEFLITGKESILPTVHDLDSIYQDMPKKHAELRRKLLQQPAK